MRDLGCKYNRYIQTGGGERGSTTLLHPATCSAPLLLKQSHAPVALRDVSWYSVFLTQPILRSKVGGSYTENDGEPGDDG